MVLLVITAVFADPGAGAVPTDTSTAQCDAATARERFDERSYDTLSGRTEVKCRPTDDHHGCVY